MQAQQVIFSGPKQALLEPREVNTNDLGPSDIVIEAEASLISQGTEGAAWQGLLMPGGQEWSYPQTPGYAHVGRVIEAGEGTPFAVGERVFSMTPHASHARLNTATQLCVRVPEAVPSHLAVFARLAMVSMSTLRTSTARLGDKAAVVGLGMVGNLAAQLCQIAGMPTTGIDVIGWRCDLARTCGIGSVLQAPSDEELRPEHALVIEATGSEAGAKTGVKLVQKHGELSLVGSQWGKGAQDMDALRFLGTIFEQYIPHSLGLGMADSDAADRVWAEFSDTQCERHPAVDRRGAAGGGAAAFASRFAGFGFHDLRGDGEQQGSLSRGGVRLDRGVLTAGCSGVSW